MSKEIRKWFTVKHDTELLEPDEVPPKISDITATLISNEKIKALVLTCIFTKYNVSKTNEIPTSAIIEREEGTEEYRVFAKLPLMFSDDNTAKIQFIDEKVEDGKSYQYKIYAVNEKNIQAEDDDGVFICTVDPVVASVPEIEFPEITFPTEPEPKLTNIEGDLSQSLDGKALMLDCIYTAPSSLGDNECLPTSTIIERKEGDGDFRVHVRLPLFFPDGTTAKIQFVDEKIDPSKIYTYRIIATNEKGVVAKDNSNPPVEQSAEISSEDIFVGEYNVYKTYNVNIRTDEIASKGSNGVIVPLELFKDSSIGTLRTNGFIDIGYMYGGDTDDFSSINAHSKDAITEANWFDGVTLRDRQINEITDFTFEISNSDVFGSTYKVLKLSNAIVEKYNFFELRNKNLKEPIHLIKLKKNTNELYISPELNRLSDVEINILLNDINDSTLYGVDFPILEVGDIAKSKNIDDWKFELYYSSKEPNADLGISENDNIVDDTERDGASDYNPSSNPDDFTLAYRGKSSKAEFTMPTNYGSIKYYSAILYIKWKKPVIERAAKLAKFLSSFIKESPGIELDNIKLITVADYNLFHAFEYSNKIVNEATIDRLTGVSDNLKEFINPPTSQVDLTDFVK